MGVFPRFVGVLAKRVFSDTFQLVVHDAVFDIAVFIDGIHGIIVLPPDDAGLCLAESGGHVAAFPSKGNAVAAFQGIDVLD